MGDEAIQSVWNFDGAELFAIFEIKKEFISCMLKWDLENAYWKVRTLRMELDAKLSRGSEKSTYLVEEIEAREGKKKKKSRVEKTVVDEMLTDLENKRTIYNQINSPDDSEKGIYYLELETFYMHLCYLMKKHGLYFREGEDMTLAVLRR